MKQLKLKIGNAIIARFTTITVGFLRGAQSTKLVSMGYTNGTGQSITAGQVFYTEGIAGSTGYVEIKATSAATLSTNGSIGLTISTIPSTTQADKSLIFSITGREAIVNLDYLSAPVIANIILEVPNRDLYKFKPSDFTASISSFDGTAAKDVNLQGDMTGYLYNGIALPSNTWVSLEDIALEKLTYTPLAQDAAYEKAVDYKVRDINNNESID